MPKCALCQEEKPLQVSHLIPAFVFRWLRKTSATGYLRGGENPRRRLQDGWKVPLLCGGSEGCEERFSRLEREFANKIFYPIQQDGVREVEYGPWFLKFCVSVSWRVLTYAVQNDQLRHFSDSQKLESGKALDRWAKFLLDQAEHPGRFEQRLVLLDALSHSPAHQPIQPNINRYFLRGIEFDAASSALNAFTFAKLGPFALFGMIEFSERWRGTKINSNEGTVGPKFYELPAKVFEYWNDRAKRHSEVHQGIPTAQLERLRAQILSKPQRFIGSGTFEAMEHDVRMFGGAAFSKEE